MRIYPKLVFVFLAIAMIPLLFAGRITSYNAKNSLQKEILSKSGNIADEEVSQIVVFFEERRADARVLSRQDVTRKALPVVDHLYADRSHPSYAEAKKMLDDHLVIFQKVYRYVDIMLVNNDGKVIYTLNSRHESRIGQDIVDRDNVLRTNQEDVYLGSVFRTNHPEHLFSVYLTASVSDPAGKRIGFVVLEVNMDLVYGLIKPADNLVNSWETLLVGKASENEAIFISPLKYDPEAILKKRITIGSLEAVPAQKAILGESGSGIEVDYRGKEVLSNWRPIPSLGWGLVVKLDAQEAFLPVHKLQKLLIVILWVTLLSIIFTALAIAKSIADPIHQLHQGTEVIAKGNLDFRVGMNTKDEIGQLSRAFDAMTANLKRSTTSIESLNKEISERFRAERKIEEQAKALENALEEALKAREILISMLDDNNQIREKLQAHIDELGRTQKMLIQSEKLASLGKLIAEIAHEVNNPLMIISGNAQLSLLSASVSGDTKKNLNIIVEECQRMKTIIQRLLKFSKPSKGDVKPTDINRSLDAVVGILENPFKLSNIVVRREYQEALPLIPVDDPLMQEVFMNLLNNAKEAMPHGGAVTLKTSIEEDRLRIDLKDTGSGMSEEAKQKLYEPFFTTKEKGTGLGLLICYGIIKAHNGELRFESQASKGTTATILLPLGEGQA